MENAKQKKRIFNFPVFIKNKHNIDIHDLVNDNIFKYMNKHKIKPSEVIVSKEEKHSFVAEDSGMLIEPIKLNSFNVFLSDQYKIENLLELIMKEMFGTWSNMEKYYRRNHIKKLTKRRVKAFIELLELYNSRPFVIINNDKIKYKLLR